MVFKAIKPKAAKRLTVAELTKALAASERKVKKLTAQLAAHQDTQREPAPLRVTRVADGPDTVTELTKLRAAPDMPASAIDAERTLVEKSKDFPLSPFPWEPK